MGTWTWGKVGAMTTTLNPPRPGQPYDVFQPNGGQPVPTGTAAERRRAAALEDTAKRKNAKLEAELEELFRKTVRGLLRGQTLKVAPTTAGAPDRLVLLPGGRMELVELKTETGRLSPIQRLWHDRARQVGILVTVLYGEKQLLAWVAKRQSK